MINSMIYSSISEELRKIHISMKDLAAIKTDDYWKIYPISELDAVSVLIDKENMLDVVCFDVTTDGAIPMLESVRRVNRKANIVIIANDKISPVEYMKPSIMAASLILRPVNVREIRDSITGVIDVYLESSGNGNDYFIMDTKKGINRILYDKIIYFEAREKKVFLCTAENEYRMYTTLDALGETLPECFIRCHRSYIINRNRISEIVFGENYIKMDDDIIVPLSRSYKGKVQEVCRNC